MKHKQTKRKMMAAQLECLERRTLFTTFTVNSLSDAVSPPVGVLTFRGAIAEANANAGPDVIVFDAARFAAGTQNTITLKHGPLRLTDTSGLTTINGPGAAALTVSANGMSRVMRVAKGVPVDLSGVTLTDGVVTTDSDVTITGAGLSTAGTVTLTNVDVTKCTLNGSGAGALGAGIYNTGMLNVVESTISGNSANALYGNILYNSYSRGGGIYSTNGMTVIVKINKQYRL